MRRSLNQINSKFCIKNLYKNYKKINENLKINGLEPGAVKANLQELQL